MELSKIYVKSNDKDRRRLPPEEPKGAGFLGSLREKFDDATLFARRHVSGRIHQTMNDLDEGAAPSLSETHRAAAKDELHDLRTRINAGGVGGLVACASAMIQCARLKPA